MAEVYWICYLALGVLVFLFVQMADRWQKWRRYDAWTHVVALLVITLLWPLILIAYVVEVL